MSEVNVVRTSRWTQWCWQLRERHGRRASRTGAGRMVLARLRSPLAPVFVTGARSVVHVHAHLGVTRLPSPASVLRHVRAGHATASLHTFARHVTHRETASSMVRFVTAPAPGVDRDTAMSAAPPQLPFVSPPRFVQASRARAPRAAPAPERTAIHELVRRWQASLPPRMHRHELPPALRHRAVREELPVSGTARLVARVAGTDAAPSPRTLPAAPANEAHAYAGVERVASTVRPIDVDALTSEVIQQLDRRFVAYRERMGRA